MGPSVKLKFQSETGLRPRFPLKVVPFVFFFFGVSFLPGQCTL